MVTKSFFEYLSIADIERIHSQFFAWIFSEDCNAISKQQKANLLNDIFNVKSVDSNLVIETEHKNIDVLIKTDTDVIVIENKLKSSQHSNQLNKYKVYCKEYFNNKKIYYFLLTLVGEPSLDKEWKSITYSDIYNQLKELDLKQNENHTIIVQEYLVCLKKLVNSVSAFSEKPKDFDIVFRNGGKKKGEKLSNNFTDYENQEIKEFITSNNLETILQKCYLNIIADKLKNNLGFNISETHGVALLNLPINNKIKVNEVDCSTVLQFQGNSIKFALHATDYKNTKKESVEGAISIMENLRDNNEFNYKKLNKPNSKTFISLSKNIGDKYWEKPIDEIVELIKIEIENAKSLTKSLIELLNKPSYAHPL